MKKAFLVVLCLSLFLLSGCQYYTVMGSSRLSDDGPVESTVLSESAASVKETYSAEYKKCDKTMGIINSSIDLLGSDAVFNDVTDIIENENSIEVIYKTSRDMKAVITCSKQDAEILSIVITHDEAAGKEAGYTFTSLLTIDEMKLEGKDLNRLAQLFYAGNIEEDIESGYHISSQREPTLYIEFTKN